MARRKGETFPSDGRRWFKVFEDILDDPKLVDCSADVFRFYFRLLAMLNRTKNKNGRITLGRLALNLCAGREQLRHSLRVARSGADAGLYALSEEGLQTVITVPKWAEMKGTAPKVPRPAPASAPAFPGQEEEEEEEEETTVATPSEPAVRVAKALKNWVLTLNPNAKVPARLNGWANEYDRMMRLDSRTEEQIGDQMQWLFTINPKREAAFVVLSPKSHRAKYDRIAICMRGDLTSMRRRKAEEARDEETRLNLKRIRDDFRRSQQQESSRQSQGGQMLGDALKHFGAKGAT